MEKYIQEDNKAIHYFPFPLPMFTAIGDCYLYTAVSSKHRIQCDGAMASVLLHRQSQLCRGLLDPVFK
jgi:hypothetical protein